MRIHVSYEVPWVNQGIDTWVDVPCSVDGMHSPDCDIADAVVRDVKRLRPPGRDPR